MALTAAPFSPRSRAIQAVNPDRALRHAADELAGVPAAGPAVVPPSAAARRANVELVSPCGTHGAKIAAFARLCPFRAISRDGI